MEYNVSAVRLTMYALISSIEMDLREFIVENLSDTNQSIILDDELINRLKRRSNKIGEFEFDKVNLIGYSDFGDCINLLNKFKKIFPKSYFKDIEKLSEELEKISPIRNRVMHSRPLEYEDFPQINDFICSLNKFDFILWNNTKDTRNKLKNDPSYVFGMTIPKFNDFKEEQIFHNLPYAEFDDTGFIGRQHDRQLIKSKLNGIYPIISIIGDGGTGKTALALRCLYDIIDDPKAPFDAIIWISLKTKVLNSGEFRNIKNCLTSALDVYKEIGSTIISDFISDNNPDEIVKEILDYMREFKILLVLDNLETINSDAIRNFLLNIPIGSKIITTSRIGIGEFESRHTLNGFLEKEATHYLRRLATNLNLRDILRLSEEKLNDICKRLYYNPLAIKWFLLNLLKGDPIESILSHTDELTYYCMSNVYEKLSDNAKIVLETLLVTNKKCSDAELGYLLDLDSIMHRKALNELIATNMVRMESCSENNIIKSVFFITDFAKEFLQNHYRPSNDSFLRITKKMRQLRGLSENLNIEININPYNAKSIIAASEDEKIAAYYLNQALTFSYKEDFSKALEYISKAKDAVPDYHEVYKISGFINAVNGDFYLADKEYETAVNCKPNYAPTLYLYAGFKLIYLEDFESAYELTLQAEAIDFENIDIKLQKARILKQTDQYKEAHEIFNQILDKKKSLMNKTKRITIDQAADNLRRWAEKFITEKNIGQAILLLREAISIIKALDSSDIDYKIIITIAKILKATQYTCVKSNAENEDGIRLFIDILREYGTSISQCNNYKDIQIGIKALFPCFSIENRIKIQEYLVEDVKEIAKSIEIENEGVVIAKKKGFAFISNKKYSNGLFFNWRELKGDFSKLIVGDKVKFSIGNSNKGDMAVSVSIIDNFSI